MQLTPRKPEDLPPARMAPLAKLPVFLDLAGKRVVVAGGAAPAAWKAELLAAAGAHLEVYAPEPSPELMQVIDRGSESGRLTLHRETWTADVLEGAALALADAADEVEAEAFYHAATSAGVLVNVIDKPAFCQFQFGAIVNRSPVIVAISTDGGAPILAQAIRRRIETVLPPALALWGRLAKTMRESVNAQLRAGAPRRRFWERFAERAFVAPATDATEAQTHALIHDCVTDRQSAGGRVTLVGAGPGDAELLTLKAVRAMQSADVILFDDLVSAEVLELARREAKRMVVGKRGQRESCAQGDINALMLQLAKSGKHVVRLKSGDPMIFGRAGEEIASLEAHGIPVEIVPGVTSALAAAARLGVSLTHRDCAQSVRFLTGHARDGALPANLDWRGLADPATTLVVYMGGRTAPSIAAKLIDAGMPASTPAVVMTSVARANEQRWHGCIADLGTGVQMASNSEPLLIGIGKAFAAARAVETAVPLTIAQSA